MWVFCPWLLARPHNILIVLSSQSHHHIMKVTEIKYEGGSRQPRSLQPPPGSRHCSPMEPPCRQAIFKISEKSLLVKWFNILFTQKIKSSWSMQMSKHSHGWQRRSVRGFCIFFMFYTFVHFSENLAYKILNYSVKALADKEVELGDSAPYFLNCAERLAEPGFLPSDEDILR